MKGGAVPLGREHMPTGFAVSLDRYVSRPGVGGGYRDGEVRIPAEKGLQQSMRGFEETYRNIIDYIVRITYRIWEDRAVGYIFDTYSASSRVFDDYGLQSGNRKIVDDTHHTTGAFSNIQLIADEIVWAGNDEVGYHTSHRTLIRGTNDGDSKYGPATGKNIDVMVIANCVALENRIFLEHVQYNNSSLILQLGLDLEETAGAMVKAPPAGWPRDRETWQALRGAARPERPLLMRAPAGGFDVDRFTRETMEMLWNRRDYTTISSSYAPGFTFRGATDRAFSGEDAYVAMLVDLGTAFPDLEHQVDEVYWMGNENEGFLASGRWSATGTHLGAGIYGEPTGQEVQVWGITQHKIVNGKIVAEWMLFNELDLMMQIASAR
jgi:predicted ester cyclase